MWQYGTTNQPGLGVNQLEDPFCASYTSAGTVLIADNLGASRVIEVRWADYSAGAPERRLHGQRASSGSTARPASREAAQVSSRSRVRRNGFANGDVFMGDADGARFFVVDRASKQIVWQSRTYRLSPAGVLEQRCADPTFGARMADGSTLIADTGNTAGPARARRQWHADGLRHGRAGAAQFRRPARTRRSLAAATFAADGSLWVADSAFASDHAPGLRSLGPGDFELPLACGRAAHEEGLRATRRGAATCSAAGVGVALDYSLDGGAWRSCTGSGPGATTTSPPARSGSSLAYRVTLTTEVCRRDAGSRRANDHDDAAEHRRQRRRRGGGTTPGGGNSGGSGTYTYPQSRRGHRRLRRRDGLRARAAPEAGRARAGVAPEPEAAAARQRRVGTTLAPPLQSSGGGAPQSVTRHGHSGSGGRLRRSAQGRPRRSAGPACARRGPRRPRGLPGRPSAPHPGRLPRAVADHGRAPAGHHRLRPHAPQAVSSLSGRSAELCADPAQRARTGDPDEHPHLHRRHGRHRQSRHGRDRRAPGTGPDRRGPRELRPGDASPAAHPSRHRVHVAQQLDVLSGQDR